MGLRDKPDRQSTKEIKCKGLRNDFKGRRSLKSMARQTDQSKTYCRIKVKIHSTLFLHSKERWFTTIGSRLQEVKPGHNKGQNTTASNWRDNQQTQRGEIFQQARLDLGI